MAFQFKRFIDLGLPRLSLVSPMLLCVAIGSTAWAASSVQAAMRAVANRSAQASASNTVSIKSTAATADETLASARKLAALAPSVQVAVKGAVMTISITSVNNFADWLNAMTAVQSTMAGYQWDVDDICMASCGDGTAAKATIRASRPFLEFKNNSGL